MTYDEVTKALRELRSDYWSRIEVRALGLNNRTGGDAPRGLVGSDPRYTKGQRNGWFLHYWNAHGECLDKAPRTRDEWVGWLARELVTQNVQ